MTFFACWPKVCEWFPSSCKFSIWLPFTFFPHSLMLSIAWQKPINFSHLPEFRKKWVFILFFSFQSIKVQLKSCALNGYLKFISFVSFVKLQNIRGNEQNRHFSENENVMGARMGSRRNWRFSWLTAFCLRFKKYQTKTCDF